MLKSIGKQSGESGESVLEKNKKATDMRKRKVLSLEWKSEWMDTKLLFVILLLL